MISALSPLDGRYVSKTQGLRAFFSEEALIRARLEVEVRYFLFLSDEKGIKELPAVSKKQRAGLLHLIEKFTTKDAEAVKRIEKTTNHDVKAVEYFLKEKCKKLGLKAHLEFIHFALTSEDVNNLAYGLLIERAKKDIVLPELRSTIGTLRSLGSRWKNVTMLSLTHGQPATPTTLGKEMMVFVDRLERQFEQLKTHTMQGKFGGAVGNYSAHKAAYPTLKWETLGKKFVKSLKLHPLSNTTQINPHDDIAELSHCMSRVNTILLDASRDFWMYIARGVFKQKLVKGEVGSSTMPHKVNPIDFENAEGNLGLSTALFTHFADKLPISRLQRDLSDSTVQRSIGSAFGYHTIAIASFAKGMTKLELDRNKVKAELHAYPEVLGEAIQTVLRKNGVAGAYEKMKELTRGEKVTLESIAAFVNMLHIPEKEKSRLHSIIKQYK